jgi:hypothetical protein
MILDFFKDDSFVLISGLSGSDDLDEETCSLIGCYGQANSVRLFSLFPIVYEFHKSAGEK